MAAVEEEEKENGVEGELFPRSLLVHSEETTEDMLRLLGFFLGSGVRRCSWGVPDTEIHVFNAVSKL